MSNIIYVDQEGKAHTIDQAHEFAIEFNIFRGTLAGSLERLCAAVVNVWNEIQKSIKPILETLAAGARPVVAWMEERNKQIEDRQEAKRQQRKNWQQIQKVHTDKWLQRSQTTNPNKRIHRKRRIYKRG
jgi:hypothetical protein